LTFYQDLMAALRAAIAEARVVEIADRVAVAYARGEN
jgi:hypothetical protein